ncbi:dihydrodipicolinate reductase-like protein CRR1, chloroplastic isoform X1 [Hevea brasiliensis]|uniref:dihydrodipicolinate reductase-like protein CRR1, chloroplastic isoform X1 n=1 Tax=Hevea brasiliensis TaxID=3981 RepID=UPI0025D7732A|nr:dihydrodipicolinate reductase-like protein CRR1, chloroplastic isoform X1 [Hevea brasiliensis]
MAALSYHFQFTLQKSSKNVKTKPFISCSTQPAQNNIKVVIIGAAKEIGMAAVVAVTKARGMEVAGAVDTHFIGEDIGKLCDMEEPLEIPIMNDLTMVLGSISQSKETGVVIDFTDPTTVYDNVKQATAFGMKSVVYVPRIKLDTIAALSALCEKASMDLPSADASQIAKNLSNLGQLYNREDLSTDVLARGQVLGEDGVRVHSLVLPGLPSSTTVYFSGPGEVYSIKHDITDVQCLMPGLLLAIRKVIRLKVINCVIIYFFASAFSLLEVKSFLLSVTVAESGVWLGKVFVRSQVFLNLSAEPNPQHGQI